MKTKFKHFLISFIFVLFCVSSCQDEISQIEDQNEQETIVPGTNLANLMSRTATNDGAVDDFLDNASCFSVELPVTIVLSDITIIIETEADLFELEDLLSNVSVDDDILDFIFPITVIFSDYSEIVIENEDQLLNFIEACVEDDIDVIECVDFIYPISFSVFNSGFNLIETIVIENDEALYVFLEELDQDENTLIVSLDFPITLEYGNGETIEVNTNEELANAIEDADQFCEDENDDCVEDEVVLNLMECPWEVYVYTNNDLDNLDGPYFFNFNENAVLTIEGITTETHYTSWAINETDAGLELFIESFYYYEAEFGNWLIVECGDDELRFEHLSVDGTGMYFEQDCDDDLECSITDISSILQECPWDFTDGTGNYDNYQLIFNDNGELQISEGMAASAIGGYWSLSSTDNGVALTFSNLTAFQDSLGGEWIIISCNDNDESSNELTIIQDNTILELEQDCLGDLGCSVEDINADILECAWSLQTNLFDSFVPVYVHFGPDGNVFVEGADNLESPIGTWDLVTISTNIFIDFTFQQGYETLNGQWQVVECEQGELYLVNDDNNIVLEQACEVNNQDLLNCYSLYVLSQECDDNNDGIATFVFETNSLQTSECIALYPIAGSYHPTYEDAVNTTNHLNIQLTTPTELASQTIYFRVFNQETHEFAIQELELIVESCNDAVFSCFGDFEIVECDQPNNVPVYNLSANTIGLVDCTEVYYPSFHETLIDAQNDVNPIVNTEAYGTLVTEVYLRIEAESGNFEVFAVFLNTVECNYFECFGNYNLTACDEEDGAVDGLANFNLQQIFANCPNDDVEYNFYLSVADAEAQVGALVSPFTNYSNPQIIYSRVALASDNLVYEIFTHELIIEDCNSNDCTEGDIDGILTECQWNITSYNGSDNLIGYNFDFESNSGIVVIYNDTITIDASWITSQNNGVIIEFSNVAGPNIQAINGSWRVVECTAEQLVLHNVNDSNNEIVLDRTCE
ncbi:hypothetical protein [Winogradskyella sp. Asnod2-B02-A]|uniref:hypothetical protein n=1 Tax=Winogradskyella sp. Asnod2-B02-A TaxID=3160583 RepID=UPI00386AED26